MDYVVGAARALELFDPAPSTLALADWCGRLGQDLFEPPNVGGWPAGKEWVSARTLISRANYVTALLDGPSAGRPTAFDPAAFAKRYDFGTERAALVSCFGQLLLGSEPAPPLRETLLRTEGRKLVGALLTAPEAQLG